MPSSGGLTINDNLRDYFLLNPDVAFLNHGSFGACPKPVFERYQQWQLELERQPVEFLGRRSDGLLESARAALGAFLDTSGDNVIFVPNATIGVNTVARSLDLQPGDEILGTDHEYGAMNYTWQFMCKRGARYIQHPIPLPVTTPEALVESLWASVTPRTKVIFISHITSPTALIMPIAEICHRAREAGILTVIDGAHAPGQIPVDLEAIGADFYSGNCHKWMSAPKGAGFLYARPEHHAMLEPLIVSWGMEESTWALINQWQGTRDISAFLTVPAAIEFQREHNWDIVREKCHALARETRQRFTELTGLEPIAPDGLGWYMQMFTAPLPDCDIVEIKRRLYDEYCVEVPLVDWKGHKMVRVSIQGYNTRDDVDRLLYGLAMLLGLG